MKPYRRSGSRETSIPAETVVDAQYLALRSGRGYRPRMCYACKTGHAASCEKENCPCICNEPLTRRELRKMQAKPQATL